MQRSVLSRRDILKLGASAVGGLIVSSLNLPKVKAVSSQAFLGRVAYYTATAYDIPSTSGKKVQTYKLDDVLDFSEAVDGLDATAYNPKWFHLPDVGYIYSGRIQPVQNVLNTPVIDSRIPDGGLLAELTVPFSDTHWKPTPYSRRGYRLYYSTNYWVDALMEDDQHYLWYRIYDDLMKITFFVHAEHLRIVPPEEQTPISQDVPNENKLLLVSLPEQKMAAYENRILVFSTLVSTGVGKHPNSWASTPTGSFTTFYKRPAGHMVGGDGTSSFYDLPGVPWTSYINDNGVSFHGTYWHNDYGTPHSHGCINLTPQDARWVYRWTAPVVPIGKRQVYQPGQGTPVYISDKPVFS